LPLRSVAVKRWRSITLAVPRPSASQPREIGATAIWDEMLDPLLT
jgi:hypothetical protein